jgi:hypothetical protein
MINWSSGNGSHISGVKNEDDFKLCKRSEQCLSEKGEIKQQESIPAGVTRKVWEPPTLRVLEINKSDKEWWLDDLG